MSYKLTSRKSFLILNLNLNFLLLKMKTRNSYLITLEIENKQEMFMKKLSLKKTSNSALILLKARIEVKITEIVTKMILAFCIPILFQVKFLIKTKIKSLRLIPSYQYQMNLSLEIQIYIILRTFLKKDNIKPLKARQILTNNLSTFSQRLRVKVLPLISMITLELS